MERHGTHHYADERRSRLRSEGLARPDRLDLSHTRLYRWLAQHQPGPFDGPTPQEWAILGGGVLLAPILLPVLIIALPFTSALHDLSWWRRIGLVLVSPVLLPAAYVHVLANEVARPMIQRWRTRRRLLKEAEGAVQELVRQSIASDPRDPGA